MREAAYSTRRAAPLLLVMLIGAAAILPTAPVAQQREENLLSSRVMLPPIEMILCPSPKAAEEQARTSWEHGQKNVPSIPPVVAPCERRTATVDVRRQTPSVQPFFTWIATADGNGAHHYGFLVDGTPHAFRYGWRRGQTRYYDVREWTDNGTLVFLWAEIPDRPIELHFLRSRGELRPNEAWQGSLSTCPAGHSTWLTDESGTCKVWNPCPQRDETVNWTGGCRDGVADGRGILRFRQHGADISGRYEGDVRDGRYHGHGSYISPGYSYVGEWRNFREHGRGRAVYPGSRVYEGEFRDGRWHGWGAYQGFAGSRYEGEWTGRGSGQVVITWRDGHRYEGQLEKWRANGRGTLRSPDGRSASGTWTDGCLSNGGSWASVGRKDGDCGSR
jgi:hypothetical protein